MERTENNLWNMTHIITPDSEDPIHVMLVDGAAYTAQDWDQCDTADYEVHDGEWLFQGQPFAGTITAR